MKKILFGFSLLSLLVLFGCQSKKNPALCPVNWTGYSCSTETGEVSLNDIENQVLKALKEKDMVKLTEFVWDKWLRLSPYSNVNTGIDIVLSKSEIIWMRSGGETQEWGSQDGSGAPILLSMPAYRDKYVYDKDFAKAPERLVDQKTQRWNTISNAWDIYSGATVIEYYFSGFDNKYEWMDRESLTLVFDKENGEWKLIGIIHGQRTI